MSVRTKSMTHFYQAGDSFIEMVGNAGGLAEYLFKGVQSLAEEHGLDKLLAEYDKAMVDLEAYVKEKITDAETLSESWPSWKARKSALRGAINNKLDPTKYDKYRQFINASTKINAEKKGGKAPPPTKEGHPKGEGGAATSGDSKSKVLNGPVHTMPDKVREQLKKALELLGKLDEATALHVIEGMNKAAHYQLRKAGGRYSNVNKATA